MNVILIILILIVNIPIYKHLFNLFFDDYFDFTECLRYLTTPDFISLFRGEYWEDQWHETKVFFYFLSNALIVSVEYLIIHTILSKIF
jgi:hypothetical protein